MDCLPVRPLIKCNSGDGAWMIAQKADQRKRFKAIICALKSAEENDNIDKSYDEIKESDSCKFCKEMILEQCRTVDPNKIAVINVGFKDLILSEEEFHEFTSVYKIDACKNNLNLDTFITFTSLTELNLSSNNIENINVNHDDFENLQILDLSFNNLNSEDLLMLGLMKNLKILILTGNNLKKLPLDLGQTFTTGNGKSYSRFAQLEELNLEYNHLNSELTFSSLGGLQNLKILKLAHNDFESIPLLKFVKRVTHKNDNVNNYNELEYNDIEEDGDYQNAFYKNINTELRIPSTLHEEEEEEEEGEEDTTQTNADDSDMRSSNIDNKDCIEKENKVEIYSEMNYSKELSTAKRDEMSNIENQSDMNIIPESIEENGEIQINETIEITDTHCDDDRGENNIDVMVNSDKNEEMINPDNIASNFNTNNIEMKIESEIIEDKLDNMEEDITGNKLNDNNTEINVESNIMEDKSDDNVDEDNIKDELNKTVNIDNIIDDDKNDENINTDSIIAENGIDSNKNEIDIEEKKNEDIHEVIITENKNPEELFIVTNSVGGDKNIELNESESLLKVNISNNTETEIDDGKDEIISNEISTDLSTPNDINEDFSGDNHEKHICSDNKLENQVEIQIEEQQLEIIDKNTQIKVHIEIKADNVPIEIVHEFPNDIKTQDHNNKDSVISEKFQEDQLYELYGNTANYDESEIDLQYSRSMEYDNNEHDWSEEFQYKENSSHSLIVVNDFSKFSTITEIIRQISMNSFSENLPKPFSALNYLDLSYNKIKQERSLIPIIAWLSVRKLSIHNNPISLSKCQKSSFIKSLLENTFKITVEWLPPISHDKPHPKITKSKLRVEDTISSLPLKYCRSNIIPTKPIIPEENGINLPKLMPLPNIIHNSKALVERSKDENQLVLMEMGETADETDIDQHDDQSITFVSKNKNLLLRALRHRLEHPVTYYERNVNLFLKTKQLKPKQKQFRESKTTLINKSEIISNILQQLKDRNHETEIALDQALNISYNKGDHNMRKQSKNAVKATHNMQKKYNQVRLESLNKES